MRRPNKKHIPIVAKCLWCKTEFATTTNPKDRKCCTLSCAKKYAVSKFERDGGFRKKMSSISKAAWIRGDYKLTNSGKRRFNSKGEIELRKYLQINLPEYNFTTGAIAGSGGLNPDIWSTTYKIVVEYDGAWHFKDINGQLKEKQKKDRITENWCEENGWRCIRIKEDVYKKDVCGWQQKIKNEIENGNSTVVKYY